MKDQFAPDLNKAGRFLRGGDNVTSWTYQDHMMGQHKHSIHDPGHKHTDDGHGHDLLVSGDYGDEPRHVMSQSPYDTAWSSRYVGRGYANIQSSHTSITVEEVSSTSIPLGNEVRPKNMIVQYIIKVL